MKNQDYTESITVPVGAHEAFQAINSVSKWWTGDLKGNSQKMNDEFTVQFGEVHKSTQKLVEVIPDKKVVWLVTASNLNFIKDKQEWNGTMISFEITSLGKKKTQIIFTHHGLAPQVECYDACSNAWGQYIQGSLFKLITEGTGMPG
jgi:Activator of Hsp90 ATPase homolog 1-like protein